MKKLIRQKSIPAIVKYALTQMLKAKKKEVKGVISDNVYQIDNSNYSFEVKDLNVNVGKEGVKKGDTIGILEVSDNGEIISQIDIVSEEDTRELLWFEKILRTITFGLI